MKLSALTPFVNTLDNIAPVILGAGRRLLSDGLAYTELSLRKEKPLKNGGVILMYKKKAL